MTKSYENPAFGLTKQDLHTENKLTPSDITKIDKGKQLAKLIYFDRLSQKDAIMQVFPDMNEHSAMTNSTRLLTQYKVIDRLYELLPSKLRDDEFEKLWHYLKNEAMASKDNKLLIELLDRYAKAMGRYNNTVEMVISRGDEHIKRLELAQKIIERKGLNLDEIKE